MVRRATASAGRSRTSLPPAYSVMSSFEDYQRVALADRLPLLAGDRLDDPAVLGLDRHLHLHRLEDDGRVAFFNVVPGSHLDLPDGAGDVCLDVGHEISLP